MKLKWKNVKKWFINNLKWIVLFICVVDFLIIAKEVWNNEIMKADIVGYNLISKYLIRDVVTPIAKLITDMASAVFLIVFTVILFITIKNKKVSLSIVVNLILVTLLNLLLKNIIQRPRPTGYRIINETGYSFPSGHSMVSMAFYGYLIYLIYKYIDNKLIKYLLISLLSILIILIGVSRIYLGVHYTSDVFGGFMVSLSYVILYSSFVNKFIIERKKKR